MMGGGRRGGAVRRLGDDDVKPNTHTLGYTKTCVHFISDAVKHMRKLAQGSFLIQTGRVPAEGEEL